MFCSHKHEEWQAFAHFVSEVRRVRRKSKQRFEGLQAACEKHEFSKRRNAWRRAGKLVCRHGVFFQRGRDAQCDGELRRHE